LRDRTLIFKYKKESSCDYLLIFEQHFKCNFKLKWMDDHFLLISRQDLKLQYLFNKKFLIKYEYYYNELIIDFLKIRSELLIKSNEINKNNNNDDNHDKNKEENKGKNEEEWGKKEEVKENKNEIKDKKENNINKNKNNYKEFEEIMSGKDLNYKRKIKKVKKIKTINLNTIFIDVLDKKQR